MTGEPSKPSMARRALLAGWLFGLLVLAAVVALGAHLGEIEHFLQLLRSLAPRWLLLAVVLQAATYLCVAATWKLGLGGIGFKMPFRRLMPLALEKLFVDQTFPSGGMGGVAFLVRALVRRGVPTHACMGALLVDLVGHYGANLLTALAGIGLLWVEGAVREWMVGVAVLFALLSLTVPIVVLSLRRLGRRETARMRRIPRVAQMLDAFADAPLTLLRRPGLVVALTALNAAVILLDAATLWVMLHALGQAIPYRVALPSFLLAMMVATLGPIPLGLGTFEATCVAALVLLEVPIEAALTGTLLLRGYTTWLPMIPGVVLARRELRTTPGQGPHSQS